MSRFCNESVIGKNFRDFLFLFPERDCEMMAAFGEGIACRHSVAVGHCPYKSESEAGGAFPAAAFVETLEDMVGVQGGCTVVGDVESSVFQANFDASAFGTVHPAIERPVASTP